MSTYQLHLLLEALARVHSFEELSDGLSVISLLKKHLGFDSCEAEAVVEGAFQLKKVRVESQIHPRGEGYLQ
jgi:hypothetical protein